MKTIARILLCILFIIIMTKIFNTDFSISSESKHGIVLAKN